MRDRVPFLGHYVLCEGVEVDPMKTAAVQDWPKPHTVTEVWSQGIPGIGVRLSALYP